NGGVLRIVNRKLRVKALPENLPDFIEADITEMRIGNKMYTKSLKTDNYKIMHPDNTVICQVRTSRTAIADVEEETEGEEGAEAPAAEGAEETAEAPAEA
ncbi:MAG: 50S ribosomal protein L25, partial [Aequorivita sp.]|nr:50S ribosomal protein L25 [Aequorivita sp.]